MAATRPTGKARASVYDLTRETEPSAAAAVPGDQLARKLQRLLGVERFEPSRAFREQALINDASVYDEAEHDFSGWWEKQAHELLDWEVPWDTAFDDSRAPFYKWFVGGKLNACYNCVDRHIDAGLGERVAFHWYGEAGEERTITYADLHRDVQLLANALKARGVGRGDIVGIYLPMVPEVVVAMLACARIGAPHNVVFDGFSAAAVRDQLEFCGAKALITADGARRKGSSFPLKAAIDETVADLERLETIIVLRHANVACEMRDGRDVWWHEACERSDPDCPCEALDAEHPLFILYTSGSTAKPKVVVHSTGGYLVGVAWTSRYVFDLKPASDVFWCTADAGWVTGHSYVVYGPLANAATSVMYEGSPDYPSRAIIWELIERSRVTILYTAPTAIRTWMKWGEEYPAAHDLSSLRLLATVGEPINPKAWLWYHTVVGGERCPIVDTWWQTETGCILIAALPGVSSTKPGSVTRPLPGIDADVVDEDGGSVRGRYGYLVLKRPWPAMLRTLYKEDERYKETYFGRFDERSYLGSFGERVYFVGDVARIDDDGYFWIGGRVDDVLNVAGSRFAAAEVESAIVAHPKVAEAAVIGQYDEDSGQAMCAFVSLEGDVRGSERLEQEIRDAVTDRVGEPASPRRIIWSDELPKTRSGKIMRRLLRDIAAGEPLGDLTTLRDPRVMGELEQHFVGGSGAERRPKPSGEAAA
jgi:acetyl-CoA synthetase